MPGRERDAPEGAIPKGVVTGGYVFFVTGELAVFLGAACFLAESLSLSLGPSLMPSFMPVLRKIESMIEVNI